MASKKDEPEEVPSAGAEAAPAAEGGEAPKKKKKRWLPLESNFRTLNSYLKGLCKLSRTEYVFGDIFGFDPGCLSWIPRPCGALLLLYPVSDENEKERKEADAAYKARSEPDPAEKGVYFIKQTIGNACGTIALLHAVLNSDCPIGEVAEGGLGGKGSPLRRFHEATKDMRPLERAQALENFDAIEEAHSETAKDSRNARAVTEDDMRTYKHFIAFVPKNGRLWELDGRRAGPHDRGATSPATFVNDAAAVCRHYIQLTPKKAYEFAALSFHKQ